MPVQWVYFMWVLSSSWELRFLFFLFIVLVSVYSIVICYFYALWNENCRKSTYRLSLLQLSQCYWLCSLHCALHPWDLFYDSEIAPLNPFTCLAHSLIPSPLQPLVCSLWFRLSVVLVCCSLDSTYKWTYHICLSLFKFHLA